MTDSLVGSSRSTMCSLDVFALHSSSIGKVMLGNLPRDRLAGWLAKRSLERVTERTLTAAPQLLVDLDRSPPGRCTGCSRSRRSSASGWRSSFAGWRIVMADNDLLVAEGAGLLRLTFNRPEKFNPLSRQVLAALREQLAAVAARQDLKCVVVTGAGDRYFAAGGDLRDLADVRTDAQTVAMVEACRGALDAVRECPVPVVAVLDGDAIGGGAELAVACDFRLMRDGAHIGFIHGRLNITAAWGGSADLYGLVGRARALRMTARCELVPAALAYEWGLADVVYDASDRQAALDRFVAPILTQSPTVLRELKTQAIAARQGRSYAQRREIEEAGLVRTWVHPDHWAAVDRVMSPNEEKR